jgi:hypothetical protein
MIGRTLGRRLGQAGGAREQVLAWTAESGELVRRSVGKARRLAAQARERARGRGAQRKLAAAARLEKLADRAEKVQRQIAQRVAGERITDRLVSLADPDARPIGKGKLGKRYEFGYVFQLAEVTKNTRRGARGLLLPAASKVCSPSSSPDANSPPRVARRNDWPATASAPRAASAISNAATGCGDRDSEVTTAREPRSAGESLAYNLDTLATRTVQNA